MVQCEKKRKTLTNLKTAEEIWGQSLVLPPAHIGCRCKVHMDGPPAVTLQFFQSLMKGAFPFSWIKRALQWFWSLWFEYTQTVSTREAESTGWDSISSIYFQHGLYEAAE